MKGKKEKLLPCTCCVAENGKAFNRRKLLRELLKEIIQGTKDPVKDCKLYKEQSCAHVDGYLCQYNTCKERIEYERK